MIIYRELIINGRDWMKKEKKKLTQETICMCDYFFSSFVFFLCVFFFDKRTSKSLNRSMQHGKTHVVMTIVTKRARSLVNANRQLQLFKNDYKVLLSPKKLMNFWLRWIVPAKFQPYLRCTWYLHWNRFNAKTHWYEREKTKHTTI